MVSHFSNEWVCCCVAGINHDCACADRRLNVCSNGFKSLVAAAELRASAAELLDAVELDALPKTESIEFWYHAAGGCTVGGSPCTQEVKVGTVRLAWRFPAILRGSR